MSYYSKGHRAGDEVDDFDSYDATPYSGGYDISTTYGHPLPPSENICFPSSSSGLDYTRPQFSSSAQPSAYGDEILANEYKSYTRPKTRPGSGNQESGHGGYGGGSEQRRPGGEFGSDNRRTGGEFGSGHGWYGGGSEQRRPGGEFGSDNRRTGGEFGSGHGGYGGGSEQRRPGGEFGSENRRVGGEFGSGQESRSDFGRRSEVEEYGRKKGGYGEDYGGRGEHERGSHGYGHGGSGEREGHEGTNYGRSEDDDYKKNSYERRHHDHDRRGDDDDDDDDDDKGRHGRKKYVSFAGAFSLFDYCYCLFVGCEFLDMVY